VTPGRSRLSNRDFKNAPRLVAKSEGMYLWNQNGDKLIDGSSGLFNVAAGHGRRSQAILRDGFGRRQIGAGIDAHQFVGQTRKYTGEPYEVHPDAVRALVETVTKDPATLAAAHLHDVVEDVNKEDKAIFDKLSADFKTQFNDKRERVWGGGIMGLKTQKRLEIREKAIAAELAKKEAY
jgi:acetylornithine/succinyldiaminopimelate/putrescine aminotransferase